MNKFLIKPPRVNDFNSAPRHARSGEFILPPRKRAPPPPPSRMREKGGKKAPQEHSLACNEETAQHLVAHQDVYLGSRRFSRPHFWFEWIRAIMREGAFLSLRNAQQTSAVSGLCTLGAQPVVYAYVLCIICVCLQYCCWLGFARGEDQTKRAHTDARTATIEIQPGSCLRNRWWANYATGLWHNACSPIRTDGGLCANWICKTTPASIASLYDSSRVPELELNTFEAHVLLCNAKYGTHFF